MRDKYHRVLPDPTDRGFTIQRPVVRIMPNGVVDVSVGKTGIMLTQEDAIDIMEQIAIVVCRTAGKV